ncbi:hypothetical protein ACFFX1_39355 [Dactylosporangium sucinum]|uniref:Uncharacterized protein n=1 Tax=Dactylosporangium sucinum TaxID=1424081 RepID=A0A917SZD0_9ACTN|nr:hypothetical protein [Dactylosporangium sucinum]GGM03344.1 hypothetical protein GCM10007977_000850 [Dactylosporangium sucinum]
MTRYARAAAAPPDDRPGVQVTWARLPVLWWRDVAVTTREPVELNEVDTFTIAAVERLGRLSAEAFEAFTGLPPLIFAGIARRLHSLALLDWRDGALRPFTGAARPTEAPARSGTATIDLLYLPTTDDLVVVGEGLGEWERRVPKVSVAAPLPERLHRVSVRTLLSERIAARRVANLPENVVGLPDGADEPLTAMAGADRTPPLPMCPVVEVAATVLQDGARPTVRVDVACGSGKAVTVDLSGAAGLVARWSALAADLAAEPGDAEAAMRAIGLTEPPWPAPRRDGPGRWRVTVDGAQARALAGTGLLTAPIGLEVRHTHARIVAAVRLAPGDAEAAAMIDLDAALQKALQDGVPAHDAAERGRLMARAWQLRYFPLVHAMREAEDFDYA